MKKILYTSLFGLHLIFCIHLNSQETILVKNQNPTVDTIIQENNIHTYYYDNGAIKEIRETFNNTLHGSWKLFYANGKLKKEGAFKNDKVHGNWRIYDTEGRLVFIENYNNGIEQGVWKAFYSNQKIKIEGMFIEGKRQGQWKLYKDTGQLDKIVTFEDDKKTKETIIKNNLMDVNFFSVNRSIGNY
ncbi:toxin-antitoxin system YwqK family antitoxin [Aquimarina sp. 2201CG14-23]|uniref:toxin-antitoxin system YwqK family antitoxin n=1 Tax=Aquimarina mycalae TaxID=3040073 RepID=UPI0024781AB7|nr:toxin-antitoxin system YwqK family antitoxin [Aquimarina sp. 2201CG14-23]MDH7444148.1 toxin-antitoxin system YwqK family antitoxin [Aquimarina sp. 2201CG14-23]